MARLSNDFLIPEHRHLTGICHRYGCTVITQLALGEYACGVEPDDMSEADILRVISMFADAAVRAEKSGYDVVQIHAAHGFFLSRFISPVYNHRTDGYGGSPENRGRIITDIIEEIRKKTLKLHISMKINCSDYIRGGLTHQDSSRICRLCAAAGIDSIEVSGNGTSVPGIKAGVNEAYFSEFALMVAEKVDIPIILVGGHRSIDNMERVLNHGKVEFLSVSRPLICEPDLPDRWFHGDRTPSKCISCNMCYRTKGHRCCLNR